MRGGGGAPNPLQYILPIHLQDKKHPKIQQDSAGLLDLGDVQSKKCVELSNTGKDNIRHCGNL